MGPYEIVVSAENNAWLEWQAMLFHHSCIRRLARAPIIVVHGDDALREGYRLIEATGGRIQRAPSFRSLPGDDYPPRNSAGTLACVDTDAAYILLCDPDMIFLRDEDFSSLQLHPGEVSADRSNFLRVNSENRAPLELACARAGVELETLDGHPIDANVPLGVPATVRDALAHEWIECIDLILGLPRSDDFVRAVHWLTSMWAFVLAVSRLGLHAVTTDYAMTNYAGGPLLPQDSDQGPALIHYCNGDDAFEKRQFHGPPEVCAQVWQLERVDGLTAAARIREEICTARNFYDLRAAAS